MPRFDPDWVPDQRKAFGRWGAGVSFSCVIHVGCRVELWFLNPVDGGPPFPRLQLFYRTGNGLGDLGVLGLVELGEHGRFWLENGHIRLKLR